MCISESNNNKLNRVPNWIVASLVGVFRNGGGLGTGKSYILVVLFDPPRYISLCFPDETLPHSHGILQTAPSCLAVPTVSFGRIKCDRSVVSDLNTVRMTVVLGSDIPPLLCRRSQDHKRREQPKKESLWQRLNPPPFHLISREYRSLSAAAWNHRH